MFYNCRSIFLLLFSLLSAIIFSCKSPGEKQIDISAHENKRRSNINRVTLVQTKFLVMTNFNQELLSNGKLGAVQKVDLRFHTDGIIDRVMVSEDERVNPGQVLAVLDKSQLQHSYNQSLLRHKQATLDYEDQLLRLGYKLSDTASLDKNTKTIARIRSGLANAELELTKAEFELSNTNLSAPFSGKIANLKAKRYNRSSGTEYFCTLLDDSELLVEFLVLEQELDFMRKCKTVTITPFNDESKIYQGTISSINPTIDKSGMLAVKARVKNIDSQLIDGMSVKIKAQLGIPNQLVIPKAALLERQGRKVVFTRQGDSAYWNYVEVAYENSDTYAIKSGLKSGDEVIYDGNFNLAHDSPIDVVNKP